MSTGTASQLSGGMRVGNYVLQERVGQGAFAQVWKAVHHERPGRVVAVKVPTEPAYRKQLAREGRLSRWLLLLPWFLVLPPNWACNSGAGGGRRSAITDDAGVETPVGEDEDVQTTVADVQNATWLVIAGSADSLITATAFAVDAQLLATNAHVVESVKAVLAEPDAYAIVVQHETGNTRTVGTVWAHPEYDATSLIVMTPDVGLLYVDDSLPSALSLGDPDALKSLEVFDDVSLCGFPGVVTEGVDFGGLLTGDFRPRATCLTGSISALRPLDPGDAATTENTFLIQYDIPTVEGTSGSAVFNSAGHVVGIHALGFRSTGDFNFAIRADKLEELLDWVGRDILEGTDLDDISVEDRDPEPPPSPPLPAPIHYPPTLEVSQPAFNAEAVLGISTLVNIAFEATIREPDPVSPSVRVFRDLDGRGNSGDEISIADNLPADTTSATLNTQSLGEGVYSIGATVNDGVNSPVTAYAPGRVNVRPAMLEVTAPDLALPVRPGTEVEIAWETNVEAETATVDVFSWTLDANGQPTGPEIPILAPTTNAVNSTTWVTAEPGQFQITVRYTFADNARSDLVDSAPRPVRVSSLP